MSGIELYGDGANMGILAGNQVISTGQTHVNGNIGVYPGNIIKGFPLGTLTGQKYVFSGFDDDTKLQSYYAMDSALLAYEQGIQQAPTQIPLSGNIGGRVLIPGIYSSSKVKPVIISGKLTLDGRNNPNNIFIFQINVGFFTQENSQVVLINQAQAKNVFWLVVSGVASIGINSTIVGTLISRSIATIVASRGSKTGALISLVGDVSVSNSTISSYNTYF